MAVDNGYNKEKMHSFAEKWIEKFNNPNTKEYQFDEIADYCRAFGFKMDCGHDFTEKYGDAFYYSNLLKDIIGTVTDVQLLGSAILSKWRFITHWSTESTGDTKNREWFIIVLTRLAQITGG